MSTAPQVRAMRAPGGVRIEITGPQGCGKTTLRHELELRLAGIGGQVTRSEGCERIRGDVIEVSGLSLPMVREQILPAARAARGKGGSP